MTGPLSGVRVVDLSQLAPGLFATAMLGDLGADVITVEPPPRPRPGLLDHDIPRFGSPRARRAGVNPLFRSRRSIVVDLKNDRGVEVVRRLVEGSDVFVEGFRPGVCARLGLGYDELSARNPRLVYCSLTGYGREGPQAAQAGHDLNYIAEAGLLSASTRPGQRPGIPLNVVGDIAAGSLVAAFGIVAALRGRDATGRGTHVDVSMVRGILAMLAPQRSWHAVGVPDQAWGEGLTSGAAPFYDCYRAADGRWLAVGAMEPHLFEKLCGGLGLPELAPLQFDESSWPRIRAAFESAFAQATTEEWLERLDDPDIAVTPVRTVEEAFVHAAATGLIPTPFDAGPLPAFSSWPAVPGEGAADPGEHSEEILAEAGYGAHERADLISRRIVVQAPPRRRAPG